MVFPMVYNLERLKSKRIVSMMLETAKMVVLEHQLP